MNIFKLFRAKSDQTLTLLMQIIKAQQELIKHVELLTQQVEALRLANTRTSISTTIKTVAVTTEYDAVPRIHTFLREAGIGIKTVPIAQPHDDVYNEIAIQIGNKYATITPLLEQIKRNMQLGNKFQLHIGNESQYAISDMTNLGTKLYELTLLREYYYNKSPQCIISARPSNAPSVQNFFSGQWLERYIACMVQTHADEAKINDFEILMNPQIVLPNGNDFELDLLVHANQRIYWIETKTGRYQDHISKYSQLASVFGIPAQQMWMILPEINNSASINLSMMYRMKVMNIPSASEFIVSEFHRQQ